jgi:hypothetical protein
MRIRIQMGLAAVATLFYSLLFVMDPPYAIHLGNEPWGNLLNLVGYFCFLGGWGVVYHAVRHDRQRLVDCASTVLLCGLITPFVISPYASAFAVAHTSWYIAICIGFFGPITGASYILILAVFKRRTEMAD